MNQSTYASTLQRSEEQRLAAVQRLQLLDTAREERFDRITRLVRYVLDVPIAAITLVDDKRQWFKSEEGLSVTETSREVSFCDHAMREQEVMEIRDARCDTRFVDNPLVTGDPSIVFYAGYPLKSPDGFAVGALCAIDRRVRDLSDTQRGALKDLADIVQDQFLLDRLAHRDVLTGLYNRRYLDDCLENEWRRQARLSAPVSLLTFDVDHFKQYNDAFGHPQGDICLKQIADAAYEQFGRASDFLARYGGEEFVVLLPGTDAAGAHLKAEQLRTAIAELGVTQASDADSPVVTISIGGATQIPRADEDARVLIDQADRALYLAKNSGRNRVCWAQLQ